MRGEFYKMDFRAWNVGTVDLTLEQEAAYLRLCHAMYDVGGPVPSSTRFLQGIFRCGNTKAAALVQQLVDAGKIQRTQDGRLTNRRVSEELANRDRVSTERRAAGKRGGTASAATRAKSLKDKDRVEALASTSINQRRGEEIREGSNDPSLSEQGSDPGRPKRKRNAYPEAFEELWRAYPTDANMSKSEAFKIWQRLDEPDRASALASVPAFRAWCAQQRDYRAIHLERFLKFRRFDGFAASAASKPADDPERVHGISLDSWRRFVGSWCEGGMWLLPAVSQPPDDPQTKVPPGILAEFGLHPEHRRAA